MNNINNRTKVEACNNCERTKEEMEEMAIANNELIFQMENDLQRIKEDNEALLENLKRIVDRIEENEMQNNFPSAYQRAKDAIEKLRVSTLVATK